MKPAILVALVALSLVSADAPPATKEERKVASAVAVESKLTVEELQTLLGFRTWRVEVPESFGKMGEVKFEQFVGGKRTLITGGGLVLENTDRPHRELLVVIRDEEGFYKFVIQTHGGELRGNWPAKPNGLPKDTIVTRPTEIEISEDEIVLMRERYFEVVDGKSSTEGPPVGESILRVVKKRKAE